ncbi:MFS transporter [Streptomyces sp. BBFR51]|uniref:MFS transporter n=1 Tax=Streptomyces sp. BBFR51 TaxID=3372856 RepID=UPI0037DCB7C2
MKSTPADSPRRASRPDPIARGTGVLLATLSIATVSYTLVQSMVNPGLEALRGHVHTNQVGVSWVLTAFLLSSAVLTPVLGRLGDRVGKRNTMMAMLGVLAVGSVISALATSLPLLVFGRVVQGAGGATLPLAFGIVRDLVPREKVGATVGMIAATSSVGGAIGVLVTGPIITHLGVPWLFWLPAIANAAVALAVFLFIPRSGVTAEGRMNWAAALALAAALVLLLLPLSLGQEWGWGSARTLVLFAAAIVAGGIWAAVETRSRHPLIDMRVFRLRPVWTANVASFFFGVTLYSSFGFIPSFLQVPTSTGYGLGKSIAVSGLLFLPITVTQFVSGFAAGPLARIFPAKHLLVLGSVPVIVSFSLISAFHEQVWQIVVATSIGGIGFGIGLSALSAVVVHAVPAEHTGAASGMNANIRTIGGAVGAALVSSVLTSSTTSGGYPSDGGYTAAFALLAVAAVAGLASCLLIPGRRKPTVHSQDTPAQRVAELADQHSPF